MKLITHQVVTALGLATLCLVGLVGPFVSPSQTVIYHLSGSASAVFVPLILNLLLLWLLLTALIAFARRQYGTQVVLWSAILFFGPWVLFKNYTKMVATILPHRTNLLLFVLALCGFVLSQWIWRHAFRSSFERIQEFLAVLLGFVSITGLLALGQLLWFNWQARSLNAPSQQIYLHPSFGLLRPHGSSFCLKMA